MAPDPVGAYQHIALDTHAKRGLQRDGIFILLEPGHRLVQAQVHALLLQHRAGQQVVQIGPVDAGVRRAIAHHQARAQFQPAQFGARFGAAHLKQLRK